MKYGIVVSGLIALCSSGYAQVNDERALFPLTEKSLRKSDVTYGVTFSTNYLSQQVYPGTQRTLHIYVPAQYDGKTPAGLCIMLDGIGFGMPVVLSNLIEAKAVPVMIVVGVPPGRVPGVSDADSARANRTYEYDTASPRFGSFLIQEIMPFLSTLSTPDGRKLLLSQQGNARMIAGGSSGAACAYNVAWFYPEVFPRVFSAIGSYTGLRGSFIHPTLLHKTEPKPLRLYLQSGENDMWTSFGDWWSANNAMVRALTYAGYDYAFKFGQGKHSGIHGEQLLPEAMQFLWKGYPAPIVASTTSRNHFLKQILIAGETFKPSSEPFPELPFRVKEIDGAPVVAQALLRSGDAYVSTDKALFHLTVNGDRESLETGFKGATALAVDASGQWLYLFERDTRRGYSYQIGQDKKLRYKQEFFYLHQPDECDGAETLGAVCDRAGRTYLATAMGIQVCDYNGRCAAILPLPQHEKAIALAFGGEARNRLYVKSASGKIYSRKLNVTGDSVKDPPAKIRIGAG